MTTPTTDPAPKKPGHGPRGVKHSLKMSEGQKRSLRNLDKKHLVHKGRPPGSRDRALVTLSELIKNAAELNGSDGKGKDGLEGWLRSMCQRYPKQFLTIIGKLLPLEVKVQAMPPPVKVFQFTPEMLERFSPEQRTQLETILGDAAGMMPTTPKFDADASDYERLVGTAAAPMNRNASQLRWEAGAAGGTLIPDR